MHFFLCPFPLWVKIHLRDEFLLGNYFTKGIGFCPWCVKGGNTNSMPLLLNINAAQIAFHSKTNFFNWTHFWNTLRRSQWAIQQSPSNCKLWRRRRRQRDTVRGNCIFLRQPPPPPTPHSTSLCSLKVVLSLCLCLSVRPRNRRKFVSIKTYAQGAP